MGLPWRGPPLHERLLMEPFRSPGIDQPKATERTIAMFRALILWMMGVPLVVVLALWYFFF